MLKESKTIELIKQLLQTPPDVKLTITGDSIYGQADITKLDSDDRAFLACISRIEMDKVYFKTSYLEQKLGKLPHEIFEQPDFYHYVTYL